MKKGRKIFLIIITLILIGVVSFYFSFKAKKQEFKFIEVKRGEVKEEISESGILEMGESVNVSFETGGKVEKIYVSENEEVKKGDLLAKLEEKEAKDLIEKIEISLEVTKKIYEKLKTQYQQLERGDQKKEILENGILIVREPIEKMVYTLDDLEKLLFGEDFENKTSNIQYYSGYNSKFFEYPSKIKEKLKEAKELYQKLKEIYQKEKSEEEKEEVIKLSYQLFSKITEIVKLAKEPIHYLKETLLELNLAHEKEELIENQFSIFSQLENTFEELNLNLLTIINKLKNYRDQLELIALDLKTQELKIKESERAISEAEKNLEKHYLFSPVSGIVSKVYIKEGESVDLMGKNLAFQILSKSQPLIKVDIYEKEVTRINTGNLVEISFPSFEGKIFFGKISSISKTEKIKDGIVYFEVKITPEDLPEGVLSGMTCDLKIIVNRKEGVLVLPREILKKKEGKYFVEVLEGEKKIEKEVEPGIFGEDLVEVLSGVSEGEKVIIP